MHITHRSALLWNCPLHTAQGMEQHLQIGLHEYRDQLSLHLDDVMICIDRAWT